MPKTIIAIIRWICILIWLGIAVTCVSIYLCDPSKFSADSIAGFLLRFDREVLLIYACLSILRGFTLLPSTPLVIAGTLIYPEQPLLVLFISLAGILLSSTMIYYFSEFLGFSDYFENHKPKLSHKLKAKLEHPLGFLFVALWAFFPLVPTDLVCYLAGTTKMNFWKFIAAIFIGELILCTCYIYFGGSLLKFVR